MRSVFNEAQSDDTLRQVGGVFYTDRYCALIFTYLLRSAAPDDRASTRAHRTEPFHLIFHLNFRSTSKTCARIIVFLRTRELHRAPVQLEVPDSQASTMYFAL